MGVLKKKLKGSTLIEVLVAMVIIMGSMGIAFMIYDHISYAMNDAVLTAAEIRVDAMAQETKSSRDYSDASTLLDNMRIEKTVLPYCTSKELKILSVEALSLSGKKITGIREIIIVH